MPRVTRSSSNATQSSATQSSTTQSSATKRSATKSNATKRSATVSAIKKTIQKKKSSIVTRFFYEDRLQYQTPRMTAVAYTHNMSTGETTYGAALFKQDHPQEMAAVFGKKSALKKALLKTAQYRMDNKGMSVVTFGMNKMDLEKQIRKMVARCGAYTQ